MQHCWIIFRCDYRRDDDRFLITKYFVSNSNSHSLYPSNEIGVNPGIERKYLFEWARCQKAIGGSCSTRMWRVKTQQPGLELDIFNARSKSGISSNTSPGWMVHFLGVTEGVFWKREARPIKWHQFRLLTRQLFLCLDIYSFCFRCIAGVLIVVSNWLEIFMKRSYCQVKVMVL
jgi:hypothetical protein